MGDKLLGSAVEINCNAVNQLKCVRYFYFVAADINCDIIFSALLCYLSMCAVADLFSPSFFFSRAHKTAGLSTLIPLVKHYR